MTEENKAVPEKKEAVPAEKSAGEKAREQAKVAVAEAQKKAAEEKAKLENAKVLTKDDILNSDDIRYEYVLVGPWKGKIRMQTIKGRVRDKFENKCCDQTKGKRLDLTGLKALLVCLCAVDESGELLFTRAEANRLNEKNAEAIDILYSKAQEMNGIGAKAEALVEGNSDETTDEDDL